MQGHVSQVLGFIWTGFQPLKTNNCEIRASITFWSLSSDGKLSELMKLYNRVWSRAIPKTERTLGGPPSDFYKDGVLWWRHHLENQLCHFILMKRFHFCLRTFWPDGSTVWLLLVTKYVDIPKKKKKKFPKWNIFWADKSTLTKKFWNSQRIQIKLYFWGVPREGQSLSSVFRC